MLASSSPDGWQASSSINKAQRKPILSRRRAESEMQLNRVLEEVVIRPVVSAASASRSVDGSGGIIGANSGDGVLASRLQRPPVAPLNDSAKLARGSSANKRTVSLRFPRSEIKSPSSIDVLARLIRHCQVGLQWRRRPRISITLSAMVLYPQRRWPL